MKWNSLLGALVIGVGLCTPSYGFEWLDRLIGIDLDNSEGASNYSYYQPSYSGYSTGYAPYSMGYSAPASSAGYAPYTMGYAPAASTGCSSCNQAYSATPQTSYRTVYQQVPVTSYQPVTTCDGYGNQVTALRPVVSYQMQPRLVPYSANQPGYAPATSGYSTGN